MNARQYRIRAEDAERKILNMKLAVEFEVERLNKLYQTFIGESSLADAVLDVHNQLKRIIANA